MSESVRVCSNCGAHHIKVFSWIDALNRPYWFCNLKCKEEFIREKYLEQRREEIAHENREASVLPEVRSFIARKGPKGNVTVVRGDSGVERESDQGQG